jgi:DNA-binding LytR/AlgR family response regulator
MINFIVCEDNKIILQKNLDIINKLMFKNNIDYKLYPFTEYTESLQEIINDSELKKIYILDVELSNYSGIDIAKEIRKVDKDSFILISTVHTEYLPYTLKSKLLIYDFISKFDDYEETMKKVLNEIIKSYPETQTLYIKQNGKKINIKLEDIIYIKHDNKIRKTIISTKKDNYEVNIPLKSIIKCLDARFVKQNGYIINTQEVDNTILYSYTNKIGVIA